MCDINYLFDICVATSVFACNLTRNSLVRLWIFLWSLKPASPCFRGKNKNIFQSFLFTTNRTTQYSLDHFLSSRGQKMSKDFSWLFKLCTRSDHYLKILKTCAKWRIKQRSTSWLLFSQAEHFLSKNLNWINTPAVKNKRFLIADVFHL